MMFKKLKTFHEVPPDALEGHGTLCHYYISVIKYIWERLNMTFYSFFSHLQTQSFSRTLCCQSSVSVDIQFPRSLARHRELMKRCCPLWQVNGFSIKRRKTAPTQKANHVMNLWNQHLLKRDSVSQKSFSQEPRLFGERGCAWVAWLPLFVLSRWEAKRNKGACQKDAVQPRAFDSQALRYVAHNFTLPTLHNWHQALAYSSTPTLLFRNIKGAENFTRE